MCLVLTGCVGWIPSSKYDFLLDQRVVCRVLIIKFFIGDFNAAQDQSVVDFATVSVCEQLLDFLTHIADNTLGFALSDTPGVVSVRDRESVDS